MSQHHLLNNPYCPPELKCHLHQIINPIWVYSCIVVLPANLGRVIPGWPVWGKDTVGEVGNGVRRQRQNRDRDREERERSKQKKLISSECWEQGLQNSQLGDILEGSVVLQVFQKKSQVSPWQLGGNWSSCVHDRDRVSWESNYHCNFKLSECFSELESWVSLASQHWLHAPRDPTSKVGERPEGAFWV